MFPGLPGGILPDQAADPVQAQNAGGQCHRPLGAAAGK